MFIILHETGEYSDYSVRMLGYVTEESKAKEIIIEKNKELEILFSLQERYYNFIEQYDNESPFIWSGNFSYDEECVEEMKAYKVWSQEKNELICNWLNENGLSEKTIRELQSLSHDKYLYKKIEEYKYS